MNTGGSPPYVLGWYEFQHCPIDRAQSSLANAYPHVQTPDLPWRRMHYGYRFHSYFWLNVKDELLTNQLMALIRAIPDYVWGWGGIFCWPPSPIIPPPIMILRIISAALPPNMYTSGIALNKYYSNYLWKCTKLLHFSYYNKLNILSSILFCDLFWDAILTWLMYQWNEIPDRLLFLVIYKHCMYRYR